jgi:ribulose 1,5-bisphosphate synthetase/thiazole synthase
MITYPTKNLPVLYQSDAVIAGGSFAGVAAALALRRRGLSVTLVEPRTYLGREVCAALRPWAIPGEFELVAWLQRLLQANGQTLQPAQEIPFQLDQTKIYLEDLLLHAGVDLLYASAPMQVLSRPSQDGSSHVSGLVIGNKSGRQVINAWLLLDATENALCARLAGVEFEPDPSEALYGLTLEFTGAHDFPETVLKVPASVGVEGNQVKLHSSYAGRNPMLVECWLRLPAGSGLAATMQRDLAARHASLRLASHLLSAEARFYWGNWTAVSYELHGVYTTRMKGDTPAWAEAWEATHLPLPAGISTSAFTAPLAGLWCLNPAARFEQAANWFNDPLAAAWLGERLAERLPLTFTAESNHIPEIETTWHESEVSEYDIREPETPVPGKTFASVTVPWQEVPVYRRSQALVAGGGTSGATAATVCAREGVQTVLVEMNPGLGGTGTLGGVRTYWMGKRAGFVERIQKAVDDVQRQINFQARPPWILWNEQAKCLALLQEAEAAGVEILWNATCVGALVQDNRVCGAVLATRSGPAAVTAWVSIDASGDGDLAVMAGASWLLGDEVEAATMWTAFPFIHAPGDGNSGNFTSAVDVSNILDLTRGILEGRRRNRHAEESRYERWPGKFSPVNLSELPLPPSLAEVIHDHGIYMAPRESRHVWGEVVLTLTDQLRLKAWPDVVCVCFSNYDVKGHSTTDWNRIGLLPPNLDIEIPYRALLPRRLDGILVAGKGFSARSDAVPSIRMQPDLENLGGAVGLAAAKCVQSSCLPREIPVREIQQRLVDIGALPQGILDREYGLPEYSHEELAGLCRSISSDPPPWDYNNMGLELKRSERIPLVEVLSAGARAIPHLERELEWASGERQVLLAQALALLGSQAGVPALVRRLQEYFSGEVLPPRQAYMFNSNLRPPDQGAMPEPVYLLYALGMARDRRSLPVLEEVADLLSFDETDLWDRSANPYHYIHAVCYTAERLGDREAVPSLRRIHAHPLLNGLTRQNGLDPNYLHDRQASLEIALGRALARCGDRQGYKILIAYLEDTRSLLVEAAWRGLLAITGCDMGKEPAVWHSWLESQAEPLLCNPYTGPANI